MYCGLKIRSVPARLLLLPWSHRPSGQVGEGGKMPVLHPRARWEDGQEASVRS